MRPRFDGIASQTIHLVFHAFGRCPSYARHSCKCQHNVSIGDFKGFADDSRVLGRRPHDNSAVTRADFAIRHANQGSPPGTADDALDREPTADAHQELSYGLAEADAAV